MIEKGVDNIVLGCTHYPFLKPIIKEIIPKNIKIIDSGEAVAKQTKNILETGGLLNQSTADTSPLFYTNNDKEILRDFLKRINLQANEVNYRNF